MTDHLESVPELTPEKYELLAAIRDVAQTADAPGAKYAVEQLARLAGEEFGYPLPEPVQREGGLAGLLFGRPLVTNPPAPVPYKVITDPDEPLRVGDLVVERVDAVRPGEWDGTRVRIERPLAGGGPVDPKRAYLVGEHTAERFVPADYEGPWPFKPGQVVRDEDGADVEWLEEAPEGVVVRARTGTAEWTRTKTGWSGYTSQWIAQFAPLTVVSVPDQQEACTDDAPAGDA